MRRRPSISPEQSSRTASYPRSTTLNTSLPRSTTCRGGADSKGKLMRTMRKAARLAAAEVDASHEVARLLPHHRSRHSPTPHRRGRDGLPTSRPSPATRWDLAHRMSRYARHRNGFQKTGWQTRPGRHEGLYNTVLAAEAEYMEERAAEERQQRHEAGRYDCYIDGHECSWCGENWW